MKTIIVNSENSAQAAYITILAEFKRCHYLRIRIEEQSRTIAQNAWTFQAYKMLSAQGDMTPSEYRNYCKFKFGLAIRAADDPEFAELLRPMLKSLAYEDKIKAMSFIDVTSTFDVEQMTTYINEIINAFPEKQLPEKVR